MATLQIDLGERIRGFFTENLNLKLLSLAFALVLYSLVHDAQDAQRPVDVGVVVRLPPDTSNRLLVSQSASKVRLTLRGSRAALDDLHVDDLGTLQVDARNAESDKQGAQKRGEGEERPPAEITREMVERQFPRLAVAVVGPPKARTQPAEVDVRLVCPPEILRGLRAEQVVPTVEVKSKEPTGAVSLPVTVSVDRCEAHVTPANVVVRW